jgi:hypothetical protein
MFEESSRDTEYIKHDATGFLIMMVVVFLQIKTLTYATSGIILKIFGAIWKGVKKDSNISQSVASARNRVGINNCHKGIQLLLICPKCLSVHLPMKKQESVLTLKGMTQENFKRQ